MTPFLSVLLTTLLHTAAFIGCLWWANAAFRQLDVQRRFDLPANVRLLIVLALGALVYSPVNRILDGLFSLFTYTGWMKVAEVVGALAVLGFVGWLYSRAALER